MKIINPISSSPFRKPIRRALPLYLTTALILLTLTQFERFSRFQPNSNDVMRRIFSYKTHFQYRPENFPKKIWQTWKVSPLDFEDRDATRARSWTQMNPGYRYEVLTDSNDLDYVQMNFGPGSSVDRPDIVETYRSLQATIIKADLLRYLIMYIEGGVYADIDVEALRAVNTWIPVHLDEKDIGLVVSVEIDEPKFANHTILGPKSQSFCQWTFMCKPRQPAVMRIIEHVIHWLNEVSQSQHVPISEISLNFDEVITGTGPSAFTAAIMAEMTAQTRERPHWDIFHNMSEPTLIGDILVLTVEAFAAGQGHSNSGNHESPKALIRHHYHASLWPSRHPRYSHPAYGMVEECNWAPDCVENWTINTAAFDSLPEEQKARLIADKALVDRERYEKEQAEREKSEREQADYKADKLRQECEAANFEHSSICQAKLCQTVTEAFQTQPADENGIITVVVRGETRVRADAN